MAAARFTRVKVQNALNELAAAGCDVEILARQDTMTPEFCAKFNLDAISLRLARPADDEGQYTRPTLHSKYLIVQGAIADKIDQTAVWMGSHNFTYNALRRNDETFTRYDDAALTAAFVTNWDTIWAYPEHGVGCATADADSTAEVEVLPDEEPAPVSTAPAPVGPQPGPTATPVKLRQHARTRLPKKLRPFRVATTQEGQLLRTRVWCRKGGDTKWRTRRYCRVVERASGVIVVKPDRRATVVVRVRQRARGTATLLPFERQKTYRVTRRR